MSSKQQNTDETGPVFANDDELTNKATVNRSRTVQMIRNDYKGIAWKGVIRETVQNAADAWGLNKSRGTIPTDADLHVEFDLDTTNRTLTIRDNAGGMLKSTLKDNLFAIDNASDDKQDGDGAGSYGRGFWVIVSCGQTAYVETRHDGQAWSSTTSVTAQYSDPEAPEVPQLATDGTYMKIRDVDEFDIEEGLGDWNAVEEVLRRNFNFLLWRDDVHVTYTIDGETHSPETVDLGKFKEEGEIRREDELDTFTYRGDEYSVRNLVIVDADALDVEPPWNGVAMLKGNKYLDHPFMTVHTYSPHNIPSVSSSDAKMFGWCNADSLCPEMEDNAHTGFTIDLQETGIKEVLKEVHDEKFKQSPSTQNKEEVLNTIKEKANELLSKQSDAFEDHGVEGDGPADGDAGDPDTDTPDSLSLVECQAGGREFDMGEDVLLSLTVNVPPEPDCESYDVFDIEIENQTTGEVHNPLDVWTVTAEPDTPQNRQFSFELDEEGMYVFRAKIRETPDILDMDYADQVAPVEDKSHVYFRVGDADPVHDQRKESDGDDDQNMMFIEDLSGMPTRSVEENPMKAMALPGNDGGFEIGINTRWPEWEGTMNIHDTDERMQRQIELGVQWAVEAVIDHVMREDIAEVAEGLTDEEGNALDSKLVDTYNERRKQLGLMELAFEADDIEVDD